MTTTHQCTDSGASITNAWWCSGLSNSLANILDKIALEGGAAGTNNVACTLGASAVNNVCAHYQVAFERYDAAPGNWTIRINVATANMNVTWESCYLCRVNASLVSQETLGSATGLAISCGSTGIKSATVSQAAPSALNAGDLLLAVCGFSNGAMSSSSFNLDASPTLTSPWGRMPAAPLFLPTAAVRRASNW